jgi:hypothetical protein
LVGETDLVIRLVRRERDLKIRLKGRKKNLEIRLVRKERNLKTRLVRKGDPKGREHHLEGKNAKNSLDIPERRPTLAGKNPIRK